jgi:hypothetical protein
MNKEQGFITLWRSIMDWEWYKNVNTYKLFTHCLLKANHKKGKWQGIEIERGQFVTSLNSLSTETGLSVRQVRTALDKLVMTNELTNKSHTKYRILTVLKYDDYQTVDKQKSKQKANKRQGDDKQPTTNNNEEPLNNDNNLIKTLYGEFVKLTDGEYEKLINKFGINTAKEKIDILSDYIGSTEKKYKSHYHTILSWARKDKNSNERITSKDVTDW